MRNSIVCTLVAFTSLFTVPSLCAAQGVTKTVTDYITLTDGAYSISNGNFKTLAVPALPSNFVVGTNNARPILAFKVKATSGNPTVKVELNDGQQYSLKVVGGGIVMTAYEVLKGTSFDKAGNNTVQFRAQGGNIEVADVVLWYQVTLPD